MEDYFDLTKKVVLDFGTGNEPIKFIFIEWDTEHAIIRGRFGLSHEQIMWRINKETKESLPICGGGRIEIDHGNRTIKLFGRSLDYGEPPWEKVSQLLRLCDYALAWT